MPPICRIAIDTKNCCALCFDPHLQHRNRRKLKEKNVKQIIVAGGVSANKGLKERFTKDNTDFEICIPSIKYCTDNAAMIAVAGYYQYQKFKKM